MKFIRNLYLNNRLFAATSGVVMLFILAFVLESGMVVPQLIFYLLLAATLTDGLLLFRVKRGINGYRLAPDRLSNGDENEIKIHLFFNYIFSFFL